MMLDLVPDVADARAWQVVMLPDDSLLIRRKDPPEPEQLGIELRRAGVLRRAAALITELRSGGWLAGWRMAELTGNYWAWLLACICGTQVGGASGARVQLLRIRWCQPELVAGQWAGSDLIQARVYLTDGAGYRNASSAEVGRLITEATELGATADRLARWWAESDGPAAEQDLALARRQQTLAARYQALEDQLADLLHVSRNVPCETVQPEAVGP